LPKPPGSFSRDFPLFRWSHLFSNVGRPARFQFTCRQCLVRPGRSAKRRKDPGRSHANRRASGASRRGKIRGQGRQVHVCLNAASPSSSWAFMSPPRVGESSTSCARAHQEKNPLNPHQRVGPALVRPSGGFPGRLFLLPRVFLSTNKKTRKGERNPRCGGCGPYYAQTPVALGPVPSGGNLWGPHWGASNNGRTKSHRLPHDVFLSSRSRLPPRTEHGPRHTNLASRALLSRSTNRP